MRYVDLGWHKDEKLGGAKQHASLTFEIADITTADGHAMTVSQMAWNVNLKKIQPSGRSRRRCFAASSMTETTSSTSPRCSGVRVFANRSRGQRRADLRQGCERHAAAGADEDAARVNAVAFLLA